MPDAEQGAAPADVLFGSAAIAAFLGIGEKQLRHRHAKGELPTFKVGGTVCARRSTLIAFFAEQEAGARRAG